MTDLAGELKNHKPSHDYFIAVDSDGCVFGTMEIKQRECFAPNIIKHWGLEDISDYVLEAVLFMNLHSSWRGCNRFQGLVRLFDMLSERVEVRERGVEMPEVPNLRKWTANESALGNATLEAYCKEHGHEDMRKALEWSLEVNRAVAKVVEDGLPPFRYARESLEKAGEKADLLVCSQTPYEALVREWQNQDLDGLVFAIAGQEHGKKAEHIALASEGRCEKGKTLMVGDAPGDWKAAKANGAAFYPIMPGEEHESWRRFHDEAMDRFFAGEFDTEYEDALYKEFMEHLPETPPWETVK